MSLETLKSLITSLIALLVMLQAFGMAQARGYVRCLPVGRQRLYRFHRGGGLAVLIASAGVALACVWGEGYVLYTPRVWLHAMMGAAGMAVLLIKVITTHRFRRYLRYNAFLGVLGGGLLLGTFITSALWYWLVEAA